MTCKIALVLDPSLKAFCDLAVNFKKNLVISPATVTLSFGYLDCQYHLIALFFLGPLEGESPACVM
jgi:hypothetical protein